MKNVILHYLICTTKSRVRDFTGDLRGSVFFLLNTCVVLLYVAGMVWSAIKGYRTHIATHLDEVRLLLPVVVALGACLTASSMFRRVLTWFRRNWLATLPIREAEVFNLASFASTVFAGAWLLLAVGLYATIASALQLSFRETFATDIARAVTLLLLSAASSPAALILVSGAKALVRVLNPFVNRLIEVGCLGSVLVPVGLVAYLQSIHSQDNLSSIIGLVLVPILAVVQQSAMRRLYFRCSRQINKMLEIERTSFRIRRLPHFARHLVGVVDRLRIRNVSTLLLKEDIGRGRCVWHELVGMVLVSAVVFLFALRLSSQQNSGVPAGVCLGIIATAIFIICVQPVLNLHKLLRPLPVSFVAAAASFARLGVVVAVLGCTIAFVGSLFLGVGNALICLSIGVAICVTAGLPWVPAVLAYSESRYLASAVYAGIVFLLATMFWALPPFFPVVYCLVLVFQLRSSKANWYTRELY